MTRAARGTRRGAMRARHVGARCAHGCRARDRRGAGRTPYAMSHHTAASCDARGATDGAAVGPSAARSRAPDARHMTRRYRSASRRSRACVCHVWLSRRHVRSSHRVMRRRKRSNGRWIGRSNERGARYTTRRDARASCRSAQCARPLRAQPPRRASMAPRHVTRQLPAIERPTGRFIACKQRAT